ncbi:MAG: DUF2764 family protein, partial [Candidatus Omnitrophota bacterium]
LHFGLKAPVSFEKFMESCRELLSEGDNRILEACKKQSIFEIKPLHPTLNKWRIFDTALRNELVKIRASRKKIDPSKYLRQDGFTEPYVSHLALNAFRNPSIMESERALDLERWRFLDELTVGHYFDIDFLIIYALKLLILEKWDMIRSADRQQELEELLRG